MNTNEINSVIDSMEESELINPEIEYFSEYRRIFTENEKLKSLIEGLSNEITDLKENLKRATEMIHETIDKNASGDDIYLLYINLKDKYEQTLKENENIKYEKEILLKHYEEKILIYKENIEIERKRFEAAENVFNEKLQVHQASADFQNDELESKWQTRLDIINRQLKESNLSSNTLRNQLVDLKNRLLYNEAESDRRVHELEQSLMMAEEKLRRAEERLIMKQQGSVPTFGRSSRSKLHARSNRPYTYEVGRRNSHNQSFVNRSFDANVSRYYEPLPLNKSENLNNSAVVSKTVSQNEMGQSPKRMGKRKLYNPDDIIE